MPVNLAYLHYLLYVVSTGTHHELMQHYEVLWELH